MVDRNEVTLSWAHQQCDDTQILSQLNKLKPDLGSFYFDSPFTVPTAQPSTIVFHQGSSTGGSTGTHNHPEPITGVVEAVPITNAGPNNGTTAPGVPALATVAITTPPRAAPLREPVSLPARQQHIVPTRQEVRWLEDVRDEQHRFKLSMMEALGELMKETVKEMMDERLEKKALEKEVARLKKELAERE